MAPNKGTTGKVAAKAAKKAKQADKAAKKEAAAIKAVASSKGKGAKGKGRLEQDEDEDLEAILERYQAEMQAVCTSFHPREWNAEGQNAVPVVVTLETPPPPRSNALLLPSPSTVAAEQAGNHLYLLFGEYFDGSRATFYNNIMRYDIVKDEWREYKSSNAPAPRSSAAGVAAPGLADGGGILIFGGEYASPTQTSFHHYKDMWVFSIKTHAWEKIEFRRGPSGRSGHRMVLWKHYIILFGGFVDTGIKTNYLADLWLFDTEEMRWKQIEHIDPERAPGARSGFSFIPCPEGAILHGGYRKEYVKGTKPKGVPLDDTWLLRMDLELGKIKWERRKRAGYMPSLRSGAAMTYWASKGMGVLFGGVLDEENEDEDMESTFYNALRFAYNPIGNGRWMSLNLKKRKKGGKRRVKPPPVVQLQVEPDLEDDDDEEGMDVDNEEEEEDDDDEKKDVEMIQDPTPKQPPVDAEDDPDDPAKTVPLTRYNAMLAIVKNTLFIYGGMYETSNPAREYTLDDFVTLNLEKLDRYVHLRGTGLEELEWKGSDDENSSDTDDEERSDEDEEEESSEGETDDDEEEESEEAKEKRHLAMSQAEKEALRKNATKFLGVAKDTNRSEEDVLSTPLPGENLRLYYSRSKEYWAGTAYERSGSRGKTLRREGFQLARAKYDEYKPLLEEIERIQKEAEVDASTAKRSTGAMGESRNRR